MNNFDMKKIKAILEEEKQTLILKLDALNIDKTRKNGPISADWEEQAQEVENDQVIDQLESIELNKLKNIEAALIRISDGSFGICTSCSNIIPNSRLEAIPFTDKCIKCG